jgi:crotonobetainyl-CoA:carnitine CoA-transferase CaiB-like acyl-CoA transferase
VGALDGIKVLEAGLLVQGPQAAALLHDWGADVVKVELPGFGDQARWIVLSPTSAQSGYFVACNRGKRSVTADLRVPAGREIFLRLAEASDVVITNFTPGTMEKWGLGYDAVAARNPRIVYATASTFGPVGPDAERAGADLSGQSAGGLISTTGVDGGDPTPVGATIADHVGSQNLAAGVLAALVARERTGRGQRVDVSLLGGQIWAQASEYTAYLLTGAEAGRANFTNPMIPGIYGIFPTADGWIAIIGVVGPDRDRFYNVIGRPDLTEKFPEVFYWHETKDAVLAELRTVFVSRPTAEWCALLNAANLRCAPVRHHAEVVDDPGAWENGYFTKADGPDGEPVTVVGTPVRFSDTPARASALVPELGQHTEAVLLELGYTWDDIGELSAAGAI